MNFRHLVFLAILVGGIARLAQDVWSLAHTPFAMPFDPITNTFRNFDRSVECTPKKLIHVTTEADVVAAVNEGRNNKMKVRAAGAGHSFQPHACADIMLNMDAFCKVLSVNATEGRVVVESGIRLKNLNLALASFGLAMPQLGLISEQSLAGAMSTGTHGTGLSLESVGAMTVVALEAVAGNGSVISLTGWRLNTSLVSLGCMGIVLRYTLHVVPAYRLYRREVVTPLAHVLADLPQRLASSRNYQFWHIPYSAYVVENHMSLYEGPEPSYPEHSFVVDKYMTHYLYLVVSALTVWIPSLSNPVNRAMPHLAPMHEFIARSDLALTYPPIGYESVRYTEMEYFIPLENANPMLKALYMFYEKFSEVCKVNSMSPVRTQKRDSITLSPANNMDCIIVSLVMIRRNNFEECAKLMQAEVFLPYGGRPHLGKRHFLTKLEIARVYGEEKIVEWEALRKEIDPENVFLTDYTKNLLPLDVTKSLKSKVVFA